jgi:hypothetical protein
MTVRVGSTAMRGSWLRALVSVTAVASWLAAWVAAGQVRAPSDTMDVSEIQPGMRGYGLTVFRGTTPERFEVEVVDVLHGFRPDQDLIIVHCEHPILEDANTVGGMSGSPIFIDDRLVGAYSYGWPFGRHPYAGVTPIANMLREMRRPARATSFPGATPVPATPPSDGSAARGRRRPRLGGITPYLGDHRASAFAALEDMARHVMASSPASDGSTWMPASTPMLVGGFDDASVAMLAQAYAPLGIDVLQAGGTGTMSSSPATPPRFVDGGGLAVTLARGDISSTVIGTVTHVEGDRLVAFGHPMMEIGEVGYPTAVARVLHILSTVQRSFKIAEPTAALGTLVQDRQAAIVVDTSLAPAMIPVHLHLTGIPDTERNEWNFEIASHRSATSTLLSSSIQSAVKSVAGDADYVTFEARSRVRFEGMASAVDVVDHGFSSTGAHQTSALGQIRAFDLIEAAYANPFEDTRLTEVSIELALEFEHHTAEIVDASVASTEVDPGQDVPVRVVLRPWDGEERALTTTVHVPESAAGDAISVLIQPGGEVDVERPEARSLEDVLNAIRRRYDTRSVVLSVRLPGRGLRTPGHVATSLPMSVIDALQQTGDGDRVREIASHVRSEVPTEFVLEGAARLELTVRRLAREETRGETE